MNITFLVSLAAVAASLVIFCLGWPLLMAQPNEQVQFRPRFWRFFSLPIALVESTLMGLLPNSVIAWLTKLLNRSGLRIDLSAQGLGAGCVIAFVLAATAALPLLMMGLLKPWQLVFIASVAASLPLYNIAVRARKREAEILRQLPFTLDLITLAVESGLNLSGAMFETVNKGPIGPLRDELALVLRDMRTGVARAQALQAMADRLQLAPVNHFVGGLIAAEKQGAALGPLLRAQAMQRRNERFAAAEKAAMQAPVKMLFPLIVFIFPCTFIVLFFPVFYKLAQEGWIQ
jgi:tight adherence protein C